MPPRARPTVSARAFSDESGDEGNVAVPAQAAAPLPVFYRSRTSKATGLLVKLIMDDSLAIDIYTIRASVSMLFPLKTLLILALYCLRLRCVNAAQAAWIIMATCIVCYSNFDGHMI